MNSNKTIQYFIFLVLFGFGISCENENITVQTEQQESIFIHNYVQLNEISEINDFLSAKIGKNISSKDNGLNGAIFDTENILQVIDTLNNTNYSFGFTFPDTNENILYNLVVGVDAEGAKSEPFVIKYIADFEHLEIFKKNESNFENFTGKVQIHKYTDFFVEGTFSKFECDTQLDNVGDPIPCLETNLTNGSSGGPASNGGAAPGATGSSSGNSTSVGTGGFTVYFDRCSCNGNLVGEHDHTNTTTFVIDLKGSRTKKGNIASKNDCECNINATTGPNLLKAVDKLAILLDLSNNQKLFLLKDNEFVNEVFNFIKSQNFSEHSKNVSKEIIVAVTENSLVSFEQEYRGRMSKSELVIFDSMSNFKQKGYLYNAQLATWEAESLYPNSLYNGRGDAFRHAFFNGLNGNLLGDVLAERLSTAHEDRPASYPNSFKEVEMDLFNNKIGLSRKNFFSDGFLGLSESIIDALESGDLRYLSNLQNGMLSGRATNQSLLIPTN